MFDGENPGRSERMSKDSPAANPSPGPVIPSWDGTPSEHNRQHAVEDNTPASRPYLTQYSELGAGPHTSRFTFLTVSTVSTRFWPGSSGICSSTPKIGRWTLE